MTLNSALKLMVITLAVFAVGKTYAAQPTEACSLLTPEQVSAALGISVGPGQHVPANNLKACGWTQQGSSTPGAKRVLLSIESTKFWAARKTPVDGITKTPASGIGDDALYITTPPFGTGLNVKKGEVALIVRVYGFATGQIEAKEKTLALQALSRM